MRGPDDRQAQVRQARGNTPTQEPPVHPIILLQTLTIERDLRIREAMRRRVGGRRARRR